MSKVQLRIRVAVRNTHFTIVEGGTSYRDSAGVRIQEEAQMPLNTYTRRQNTLKEQMFTVLHCSLPLLRITLILQALKKTTLSLRNVTRELGRVCDNETMVHLNLTITTLNEFDIIYSSVNYLLVKALVSIILSIRKWASRVSPDVKHPLYKP